MKHTPDVTHYLKSRLANNPVLKAAHTLALPSYYLSAGFIRNLIWDYHHKHPSPTALNDYDLVYYCTQDSSESRDHELEHTLNTLYPGPWSVKNQARMHLRHGDAPYTSTLDAMSYWPEIETAIGVTMVEGQIALRSPFPIDAVLGCTVTYNQRSQKREAFEQRLASKGWLTQWPHLKANREGRLLEAVGVYEWVIGPVR